MHILYTCISQEIPQADGRRYVSEIHRDESGQEHRYQYLAEPGVDVDAVAAERKVTLEEAE